MIDIGILLIGISISAWVLYKVLRPLKPSKIVGSNVLLDKIKTVCRLVTAEGTFIEILHHKDTKSGFFDVFKSEKKAILLINAKVLVGFDVEKMSIELNKESKTINIISVPQAQIISIETEVQFYDIKNGTFNKFKADDLSSLTEYGKKKIHKKVYKSDLPLTAKEQLLKIIEVLAGLEEFTHWKIQFTEDERKKLINKS